VPKGKKFTALTPGGYHTCGLLKDGTGDVLGDEQLQAVQRAHQVKIILFVTRIACPLGGPRL